MSETRLARHRATAVAPLAEHTLIAVRGRDRVQLIASHEAHAMLRAAGATDNHAQYRLKRACDQGAVRYMLVDRLRRLYAAEDVQTLAAAIHHENATG